MVHDLTVSDHILEVMRRTPDCRLDDLVLSCREFPLQSVLTEVSRMSRRGQLNLTLVSTGSFTVQLLSEKSRSKLVKGPCAPEPISAHLTCNESQLEALMSEGEST